MRVEQTVDSTTASPEHRSGRKHTSRRQTVVVGLAVAAVVGVSLVRIITLGFDMVAADDAAYVHVGRELWRLQVPHLIDGTIFTIRSWVFPLLTGGASLLGSDPFTGPRVMSWTLATAALALSTVVAARISNAWAAVATAVMVVATPILWSIVPTTHVDTALALCVIGLLLVVDKPTPRHALIGGLLGGLTLLVKETSAPLVFLPLAYLGTMPRAEWRRLAVRYVGAFAVTVGWWFVVVLAIDGEIFPLQGLNQAAGRGVPRAWDINASVWLLVAVWVVSWTVLVITRRREPRARLLLIAGLAFLPATAIAWADKLALRQFVPIALVSTIAVGVAVVDVIGGTVRSFRPESRRAVTAVLVIALTLVMAVPVVLTQDRIEVEPSPGALDVDLAAFFSAREGSPDVLTTFKYRTPLWVRLDDDATLHDLRFDATKTAPDLESAVTVDVRPDGFHTLTRDKFRDALRGNKYLVLSGPGRWGPAGLATWLRRYGANIGLPLVASYGPPSRGPWAYVFEVDNPQVDRIPTVVSGFAAEAMLAGDGFTPTERTTIAGTAGSIYRVRQQVPPGSVSVLHARPY